MTTRGIYSVLTATLCLVACEEQPAPSRKQLEVSVVTVAQSSVTLSSELTGRITATSVSEVRPQVTGLLQARLFEEGQAVQAGQALYQIEDATYRAVRDQAAATLSSAKANARAAAAKASRYRTLQDIDAVSKQDIDDVVAAADQAQAAVLEAKASLKLAQLDLDYTRIDAPISGRIGRSTITPGALVTASQDTALSTIQQLDPIYVDLTQSSSRIVELRRSLAGGGVLPASTEVELAMEDGSTYDHPGKLEFAEVNVDADTGTVTLRAQFPNPDGLLMPGMFVRVRVPEAVQPNAIVVPQQGVVRDAKGNATAWVLAEHNVVAQREIVAERAIGDSWLVSGGLEPGDRLIVEGTSRVRAGMTVTPVSAQLSQN